ncbi:hypothetical protein KAR91_23550 [Candidatus Pacearchaeota archaeon]|nr:hypothetical protein [Candidatus Pacearchaeota archaeon]
MNIVVEYILNKIDRGLYFDSHFIIDTVIRDSSDDYLTFVAKNQAKGKVTEYVHSELAKVIASFDGILVRRVSDAESYSYNIRGKASRCALWVKI